jgi:hypothetical protein
VQRQRQLHWVHYTDGTERGDQEVPGLFQARREFGAEMNTPFLGAVFGRRFFSWKRSLAKTGSGQTQGKLLNQ